MWLSRLGRTILQPVNSARGRRFLHTPANMCFLYICARTLAIVMGVAGLHSKAAPALGWGESFLSFVCSLLELFTCPSSIYTAKIHS